MEESLGLYKYFDEIEKMHSKNHQIVFLILSSLALNSPLTSSWAAPPAGRLLASQCAQCHGTDGQATGDIDSLRGERASEIYDELQEMKYSTKTGDIMHRQAKGYTDQQLWLIAQYYGGLGGSSGATARQKQDDEHEAHEDDD
jgi:cytochrome c553